MPLNNETKANQTSDDKALVNMEYLFIAITPKSTLARNGSIW